MFIQKFDKKMDSTLKKVKKICILSKNIQDDSF